jgi:outer membrane murein-binding lipoprotein Lpp
MDLFGRKERIEELEEELASREEELTGRIEELENRLEKEQERARQASAAKQDAEERINRLEDKIASLEDRVDGDQTGGTAAIEHHDLDRPQTTELIENLGRLSYRSSKADTIYSTAGRSITDSETGEMVVADPHLLRHAIQPPIPVQEEGSYRSEGFMVETLEAMLQDRYCLLHLTAGGSGIAVIEDGEVVEAAIVDADIKAKHTKGGYSQKRFERRRQEQIEEHLEAVMDAAAPLLEEGYRELFLAGGPDLREQAQDRLDQQARSFGSRVSRIEDEDDLARSFRTGFRFQLQRLDDGQLEEARDRL